MPTDLLTPSTAALPGDRIGPRSPAPFGIGRDRQLPVLGGSDLEIDRGPTVIPINTARRGTKADPAAERLKQADIDRILGLIAQSQALVERAPRSPTAMARHAATLLSAGRETAAVVAARTCLELCVASAEDEPLDVPSVLAACRVLGDVELYEEAEAFLARLHIGDQDSFVGTCLWASVAASQGKFELALSRLRGVDQPEVRALRGYLLLEVGQFQRALHELRAARHVVEDSRSLLGNMAYAYAALGSLRKAVKAAREAWLLAPHSERAALDLAFYLNTAGQPKQTLEHLRAWAQKFGRGRPGTELLIPRVNALLALSRPRDATRALQAALASPDTSVNPVTRAEIAGNAEYLRWLQGEVRRAELINTIRKALAACDQRSIALALMLADVSPTTDALTEISRLYETLLAEWGERPLLGLRTRLCALAGDFEGQLRAAEEWQRSNPLDPDPVIEIVFLRGTMFGDHKAAARIGEDAVRRFPAQSLLRNNVAYEMILAHEYEKAREILSGALQDDPFVSATRGLLRIVADDVAGGIADYRAAIDAAAARAAEPEDAEQFRRQVSVELRLLARELPLPDRVLAEFPFMGLPPAWRRSRSWRTLEARAHRLGLSWPPQTRESSHPAGQLNARTDR